MGQEEWRIQASLAQPDPRTRLYTSCTCMQSVLPFGVRLCPAELVIRYSSCPQPGAPAKVAYRPIREPWGIVCVASFPGRLPLRLYSHT